MKNMSEKAMREAVRVMFSNAREDWRLLSGYRLIVSNKFTKLIPKIDERIIHYANLLTNAIQLPLQGNWDYSIQKTPKQDDDTQNPVIVIAPQGSKMPRIVGDDKLFGLEFDSPYNGLIVTAEVSNVPSRHGEIETIAWCPQAKDLEKEPLRKIIWIIF